VGGPIVVGTDGSETATAALQEAIRLADKLGDELHVVSAYQPLSSPAGLPAEYEIRSDSAVTAVLEASGQRVPRVERPSGLTAREAQVVGLLARGLQTKQVARALGISTKTADRHVQNAYRKIGVSTRAAAALFAMEHGLVAWGELPISRTPNPS